MSTRLVSFNFSAITRFPILLFYSIVSVFSHDYTTLEYRVLCIALPFNHSCSLQEEMPWNQLRGHLKKQMTLSLKDFRISPHFRCADSPDSTMNEQTIFSTMLLTGFSSTDRLCWWPVGYSDCTSIWWKTFLVYNLHFDKEITQWKLCNPETKVIEISNPQSKRKLHLPSFWKQV